MFYFLLLLDNHFAVKRIAYITKDKKTVEKNITINNLLLMNAEIVVATTIPIIITTAIIETILTINFFDIIIPLNLTASE